MFVFSFGSFRFDPRTRQLTREGQPIPLPHRHADLLQLFLAKPREVLPKEALIAAAWPDVAITDNALEQAISSLRKALGSTKQTPYIETLRWHGYRFAAEVTRVASRESDQTLDALLAPHRAWLDGRAALETLERDEIARARLVFDDVLAAMPEQAAAHVGLANACAMAFEITRTDAAPDTRALATALEHSREACRLDPAYGEAWATLGFVLARTGPAHYPDALAASRRAVSLEPDNWRHHLRLSSIAWGEERLREARRTLALLPGFPLAHWLAASVHVARQAIGEAERELHAAIAAERQMAGRQARFTGVALHWLMGLIHLSRDEDAAALASFDCELAREHSGHLYARECCANTWYAIGALHLRRRRVDEAAHAFREAIERVSRHVLAHLGLALLQASDRSPLIDSMIQASSGDVAVPFEQTLASAIRSSRAGAVRAAAQSVCHGLETAPAGSAGWLLPIEPMLCVHSHLDEWRDALMTLRMRAA